MEAFLDSIAPVWRPHSGQRAFLIAPQRYRVLACGRRWGKTDACAVALLAHLEARPGSRQLLLAPTLVQADLLFERVVELADALGLEPKVKRTPHPAMTLGDGRLFARSGHVPRSLRGLGADHIVVDEAAFVQESLITDIALPMLATSHGRLTLLSTPMGKNHFWRFYRRGLEGEPDFWSAQAPSSDSPLVSTEFLALQRELLSERAFRVEYEAAFLDSSYQVFKTEAIEACVLPRLPQDPAPPFVVGVDWAKYSDYTAVAVLSGSTLVHLERFHGLSWAEQVRRVAETALRFPGARILCDATGVGDPVVEMLRSELVGHRVEGLVFTADVKRDLIEGLAMRMERAEIRFLPHPDLLRELQHFEAQPTAAGNTRLSAPSGYHDDLVIALALAVRQLPRPYAAQIAASGRRQFSQHQHESESSVFPPQPSRHRSGGPRFSAL